MRPEKIIKTESLYILVDYFNIEPIQRERGLQDIIPLIIQAACQAVPILASRFEVRLYGGWYMENDLTQHAQLLLSEIEGLSSTIIPDLGNESKRCTFTVQLAQSLLVSPSYHIFRTLRKRQAPKGIRSTNALKRCPEKDKCYLKGLPHLLKKSKCPSERCGLSIHDLVKKTEQKMVDSMICADASYLITQGKNQICIASSDEDILPIIILALNYSTKIIHLECAANLPRGRTQISDGNYFPTRI